MDEYQLEDLKRFIANTVSQTEVRLREDLASKADLELGLDGLRTEVRDGFAGVADALDAHAKQIEDQLVDHDQRISTLEQAA